MGTIKKINLSTLDKDDNNRFVELQRQTFLRVPRDDHPWFSAGLLRADNAVVAYFFHRELQDLFVAVEEHERSNTKGKILYIMKVNSARSNPIAFAPYELTEIGTCPFMSEPQSSKLVMARHPFAPYEAIKYEIS